MDTFQGWDARSCFCLLAVVPEEPAVRVLAIDFTQEGNDEGEVLFDPRQCFPSRHLIECVLSVHEEVVAIGMELQRLPCEVDNLLRATLSAPVLQTLEVNVVEGLAQLSCRVFDDGWFLKGMRQEQNRNQLPNHKAHTDRPNVVVLLGQGDKFIVAQDW